MNRRLFLKMSAFGVAAVALVGAVGQKAVQGLSRLGIPVPWYRQGPIETTFNYCNICPWRCGIIVKTVNGKVRKIEGNPLDPKSRGMLCARGQAGPSFIYDPDRLSQPMIRVGERGAGEFRSATWEEALDVVADGMKAIAETHGQESIAFFGHTSGDFWFTDHLPQAWGSPNASKASSSLCTSPREEASILTMGTNVGGHEPVDWDYIECLVLIGTHIGEDARNTMMQDLANAKARGAKVIVVDPRFSTAATKADWWLAIKPGTDTALLLAWMNVLIAEDRYDVDFVAEWTEGFEELATHVAEFTPEWAAKITDLPADSIRNTGRMLGTAFPASAIVPGRHTTWYGNDTQRMRAVYIINSLLGAYGRKGGIYLGKKPLLDPYPQRPYTVQGSSGGCAAEPGEEESAELPLGPTGKVRADGVREKFLRGPTAMQELIEPMITGDPYPIKGLFLYGLNLLHTIPNPERTKEALRNLDLVVGIDVLPQDHIAWCDVVLPEASYLERYDELWACKHKTPYIAMREPAVEPFADTKPAWWMARELGLRLGLDPYFKWETIEEYLDRRLLTAGSSLEKMRAAGGIVVQKGAPYLEDHSSSPFMTPSGKIQLYSAPLADAGFDAIPVYEPIAEPPPGSFRLLYGRHPVHTFAMTQNTPALSELYPENEVWISASAAPSLGVRDGDRVVVRNEAGVTEGPVRAKVTQRIRQDAVYMVHGFGHKTKELTRAVGRGASDAALMSDYALDPICGGAGMRVTFVTIEREA
ncbi:MAG: thiosulfate reductase [Actinobacteria bacterium]|nr:MAG: thiosulfate reductase [Actinomycetota bacterium]